jgi:hypothetical protein
MAWAARDTKGRDRSRLYCSPAALAPPVQQCCPAMAWCFRLLPQSRLRRNRTQRLSQSAPLVFRRIRNNLASPVYTGPGSPFIVSMLTLLGRRVISRIRRLNPIQAFGAMARLTSGPAVKLNPSDFHSWSGIQECPDDLQQRFFLNAIGDLTHQFVVVDSIRLRSIFAR